MSILVSGSLVYDHIMDFPDKFKNHIHLENIHILNIGFPVQKLKKTRGGTAGNIAYNLNLIGAEPVIASSVGQDGKEYLDYLKKQGLDTGQIGNEKRLLTASCYIITDRDDNQISAFYAGALNVFRLINFKKIESMPQWAIISPTKTSVMIKHLRQCAESGLKTIFDPGQQIPALGSAELKKSIKSADVLIGNDYEIRMIQKRTKWSGADILKNTGILITTFGEKGSIIKTNQKEEIRVEACRPKKVVDPTGAGDAYRAGFVFGLDNGHNLRMCGRLGSVCASFAIEKYGTQEHRFSKQAFAERYKRTYREDIIL